MKKIGIITLTGNKNYGNKLQNYALASTINKLGFDTYTIWCNESFIKKNLKKIKYSVYSLFNVEIKRKRRITRFNNKYLKSYFIKKSKIEKLNKTFFGYVIGSDQIWNPNIINNYLGLSILGIGNNVFSYAASIGISEVNNEYKKNINKKLTKENIEHISVREETAKRIIKESTKRSDIEVSIDPTLLLTKEEWSKIEKKPLKLKDKKYILTYFLGGISHTRKKIIKKYAEDNNYEIINLLDKNDPFYTSDPSEFIFLVLSLYIKNFFLFKPSLNLL